jgi:hypothetical protein
MKITFGTNTIVYQMRSAASDVDEISNPVKYSELFTRLCTRYVTYHAVAVYYHGYYFELTL